MPWHGTGSDMKLLSALPLSSLLTVVQTEQIPENDCKYKKLYQLFSSFVIFIFFIIFFSPFLHFLLPT